MSTKINREALAAALHVHALGLNVTSIPEGGKEPSHDWNNKHAPWATQRQQLEVVRSLGWYAEQRIWNGRVSPPVETIGVINGIADLRTIDLDAITCNGVKVPVPTEIRAALLTALGLPLDYEWSGRSKSGAGLHILITAAGELPESWRDARKTGERGVIIFEPLPACAGMFDHIELRWKDCQTALPRLTGYNGHLPDVPPEAVELSALVGAIEQIAAPKLPQVRPAAPTPRPSSTAPSRQHSDVIGAFNAAYRVEDIIERNGYSPVADGWAHPGSSQPGVVGVKPEGDKIRSFSATDPLNDGQHAHDAFSAFCTLEHGGDVKAAVKAAAGLLGVLQIPPREAAPQSSAPHVVLSRGFVLKCLKEEEAGDAQLLTYLYQGQLCYDRAAQAWYEFAEHAWHRLNGPPRPRVWGRAAAVYLALAAELQAEQERADEDEQKKLATQVELLIGRAKQLRRLNRCNNVLTLSGDEGMLGIAGDVWDSDPWLLGVANGVIDLRTGQRRDGRPEDFIKSQAPTAWAGLNAPAPRWERFVSEVMSDEAERVGFLHRLLGYSLNGTTREHVLALLVGYRGRNGKRVLMETLLHVLGDGYAGTISTDVVIGQDHKRIAGSAQPHLMELQGKRLAICSETGEGAQMSAAQVKNITGGDRITARWLNANPVTFTPSHTIFLQTNRKPQAPADDDALWERVKVIEFKVRFVDEPKTADERARDLTLEPALLAEAPGILAWLVRGHLAYLQGGLQTPPSVRLARDTYRKGESLDPFLEACCTEWDGADAEAGTLWEAYKTWCEAENLKPKSQHWFGRQLAVRYEKGRVTSGPGVGRTCYYGVGLDPEKIQDIKKGSEGIGTLQTEDATPVFTESTEPFTPVSDPIGEIDHHEEISYKNASKVQEVQPHRPADPSDTALYRLAIEAARQGRWGVATKHVNAIVDHATRRAAKAEVDQLLAAGPPSAVAA